jgi:hypothetical protein
MVVEGSGVAVLVKDNTSADGSAEETPIDAVRGRASGTLLDAAFVLSRIEVCSIHDVSFSGARSPVEAAWDSVYTPAIPIF